MTTELTRQLLDACFYGKQITELMPPLPPKIKPRHMHVINAVHVLSQQGTVRIGDVSRELRVTTPSVTKLINELSAYGAVEKHAFQEDKRVTTLTLTALGEKYYVLYIQKYHAQLARILDPLDENDCYITIQILKVMAGIMREHPIRIEM